MLLFQEQQCQLQGWYEKQNLIPRLPLSQLIVLGPDFYNHQEKQPYTCRQQFRLNGQIPQLEDNRYVYMQNILHLKIFYFKTCRALISINAFWKCNVKIKHVTKKMYGEHELICLRHPLYPLYSKREMHIIEINQR